jgi:hypothetical protein
MSGDFDPYRDWLDVQPDERPVDHYRLLGLKQFESDPEVIRAAAEQRVAQVGSYASGLHADTAQRLLNDLAAARFCLLDTGTKCAYDATLRQPRMPAAQDSSPRPAAERRRPPPLPSSPKTTPAQPREPTTPLPSATAGVTVVPDGNLLAIVATSIPEPGGETVHLWVWLLAGLMGGLTLLLVLVLGVVLLVRSSRPKPTLMGLPPQVSDEVAVETEEQPNVAPAEPRQGPPPPLVTADGEGAVWLLASQAGLWGGLERTALGGEELIGGWRHPNTAAEWRFQSAYRGVYRAELKYASTADPGAGRFVLEIDGEPYEHTISLRGGPDALKTDDRFVLLRTRGEHTLVCRPLTPSRGGLMRLHSIRLTPVSSH